MIAEMIARAGGANKRYAASMRPRSYDRGNTTFAASVRRYQVASMRPRSYDRGNVTAYAAILPPHTGFNEAAIL